MEVPRTTGAVVRATGRHAPIHPRPGHRQTRAASRFIGTGCMCHVAQMPAALLACRAVRSRQAGAE